MAARSSLGEVTELSPGRWLVRVTAGTDAATGARVRPSKVVRGTRRDAEAERVRMLARAGRASGVVHRVTVAALFEDLYLPWCEGRLRPNTLCGYRSCYRIHIRGAIGGVPLGDLSPRDVESWLSGIGQPGARRAAFKLLRQALRRALRWELVDRVVTDAVEPPKVPRYDARVLDAAQAREVVAAFRGHAVEAGVLLALGCGMRRSEICAVDWTDFGPGMRELMVRRGFHVVDGVRMMTEPKSANSARTVSLPAAFAARVAELGEGRRAVFEDMEGSRGEAWPLMLEPSSGARMLPSTFTRLYGARCREAGCPHVELKNLRHSHATIALAAGVGVVDVSRRLGHSSVSVTDHYYLRPTRAADEAAADAFDAMGVL